MEEVFQTVKDYKEYLKSMIVILECTLIITITLCKEPEESEYIRNTKILQSRYKYYFNKVFRKRDIAKIDKELLDLDKYYFGDF